MELTADDRLAIQELCARACHTIDFDDADGYAALFLADGVFQRQASQRAGGAILFRHRAARAESLCPPGHQLAQGAGQALDRQYRDQPGAGRRAGRLLHHADRQRSRG